MMTDRIPARPAHWQPAAHWRPAARRQLPAALAWLPLVWLPVWALPLAAQETPTPAASSTQAATITQAAEDAATDKGEQGLSAAAKPPAAIAAPPTIAAPTGIAAPANPLPPADLNVELNNEQKAAVEDFIQKRQAWAKTLADLRGREIRFSNNVDRSEAAVEELYQLRNQAREQLKPLVDSAKSVYRLINRDAETGSFLVTLLDYRRQFSMYDDSFEAAKLLLDSGVPTDFLYTFAARAAFVEGRFDEVLPLYKRFVEKNGPEKLDKVDQNIGSILDIYPQWWQEEVAARQADEKKGDLPRVLLETTRGPVVLEMFEDSAPNTVANFIRLVEEGFYDDSEFYQVIDDLLAVGGDPVGDGSGTTGKVIPDEHDAPNRRRIMRGSVFMAKIGDPQREGELLPNTASCQFVIALMPMAPRAQTQTVFARVIEGLDVVCAFRRIDPTEKKESALQLPPERILRAKVLRKRDHDYTVKYAP